MTCQPALALLCCLLTLPSEAQALVLNKTYDEMGDRTTYSVRLYAKQDLSVRISAFCDEGTKAFRDLSMYFQMGDEALTGFGTEPVPDW